MKNIKWLYVLLLAVGCTSTTKITSTWKDPKVAVRNYNKILVLGLIRQKDKTVLENMEQHFVGDLTDLGYIAISALQEYGPKAFDRLDEKTAIEKIKSKDIDAVITIVLLNKEKEKRYVPGRLIYSPYMSYYNRFWGYRTALYNRIYEPGYYVTDTKYFWEVNFYDMVDQSLIYSVQTKSFSPSSTEIMGHENGKMVIRNMEKQKILVDHSKVN